ncbi:penicillin-binding protein 2 [Ramlibacter sp. USB13]|uniref:Peptidoglycan D,D-transpeptidase MrdA n=1 Tax=Ramlibacter cellulosilyticus TaxID=2764187 RepID=A0A923SCY0_9BURK|nr:penicillin-binding protein 2 [Ramlibacter cellulosilyticus]MBC5785441.1 penicillin-binding protein 2 [Ramlibacter cellulosilyticus]
MHAPNIDAEARLLRFRRRVLVACAAVLACFGALVARLVWLQVLHHEDFETQAAQNSTGFLPIVPNRGLITDRNGIVLAANYPAYTLEITRARTMQPLETLVAALGRVVDIEPRDRERFQRLLRDTPDTEPVPIRSHLSDTEVARFAVERFRFPGVRIQARLFRSYPWGELAAHAIGYVGRINAAEKERIDDGPEGQRANYRGTDVIGKLGVEAAYERELHGTTGVQEMLTTASGRAVRRVGGRAPRPGKTLRLTIDARLQKMVEDLYGERRGALVALDPRSGEVLAFVSQPAFDPNLFVDGIAPGPWRELNTSPDKPLLDRALRGTYPPGSTYKPYMALIGLETGARQPGDTIADPGYFWLGNHKFRDDKPGGHGRVDMYRSIVVSCDTYYYQLANDLGVDTIHDYMLRFGFGTPTGIDIPGEVPGLLPSTDWKREAFRRREQKTWYAGETISLGIGQGYNSFTMLQLANAVGGLANGGVRMRPHLAKELVDEISGEAQAVQPEVAGRMDVLTGHLAFVQRAMQGVNQEGTGSAAFRGAPYTSAGKTGTAQLVGLRGQRYDEDATHERLRDHGLFIAYAPVEDPRIAVALVVENAGFGSTSAAPIARRVLDFVLAGLYPGAEDMQAVREGRATAPVGTPRTVDAAWPPLHVAP